MTLTLADAWLHDLSPFAVRFTETLGLRWYGLAYAMGFLLGYLQLRWLAKRGLIAIPAHRSGDAILTVVVGVVVGGRLGYVLLYEPSLLWSFSSGAPWWGVLAINRGGMASHGGMIGVAFAAWRISRGWKQPDGSIEGRAPLLHIADAFAFIAPAGLFFGRVANFINGELLGRIAARPGEPAPWWSVRFPQEVLTDHDSFRSAAQEQALDQLIFREARLPNEAWETVYHRIVEQIQSGSPEGNRLAAELAPLLSARYPSQLMQAAAEGVVLAAVLWVVWAKPRKPGVVGAWFLISYGLMRVLTELVRLPDAQFAMQRVLGLSRGQWFSVLMAVIGVLLLARLRRSDAEPRGGWIAPNPTPNPTPKPTKPSAPTAD